MITVCTIRTPSSHHLKDRSGLKEGHDLIMRDAFLRCKSPKKTEKMFLSLLCPLISTSDNEEMLRLAKVLNC